MEESNITYTLEFDEQALKDIQLLKKSEKQAYNVLQLGEVADLEALTFILALNFI